MTKRIFSFLSVLLLVGNAYAGASQPSLALSTTSANLVVNTTGNAVTVNTTAPVNPQTGTTYTISASDMGQTVTQTNGSAIATTLPSPATTGFGAGAAFIDLNLGAGINTITPQSGKTINGAANLKLYQRGFAAINSDGSNYLAAVFPGYGTITSGALVKYTADTSGGLTAATAGTDYQAPITLTTTGTSGASTLTGGTLNIPQYAGGGGGTLNYAKDGITATAGTYYAPIGGGGLPSATEAAVAVKSPSAMTAANLQVSLSAAPGAGNTLAVTLRLGGVSQSLTCTISGASATACQDLTHGVNVAQNDVIDWQIVTTGTISGTPTINITANGGTSNVGLTSLSVVTANGVSASITNPTTTPALTFSLGDITPANVTATGRVASGSVALTISGAAVATDASLGNYFYVTLTNAASTAISNPTNPVDGQVLTYELTQNGSGSNAVTWGSAFDGCASGIPTISTVAGKVDIIGWRYSGRLSKWVLLNSTGLGC